MEAFQLGEEASLCPTPDGAFVYVIGSSLFHMSDIINQEKIGAQSNSSQLY